MIINNDCLKEMKTMNDRSVDLFILDPPYYKVANEKWDKQWKNINEYLEWIEPIIKEINRISKMSGSFWLFGFPYQLTHILPIVLNAGFTYRQQIVVWKGMKSAVGRVSKKLKMYPTTTESIFFFVYESRYVIRNILQLKKKEFNISPKDINEYLGKSSNGGGTWSGIAGPKQKTLSWPTRDVWNKLDKLFNGLPNYDDLVFKFNLKTGLTDVWDDINFYDRTYKKIHPTQKPYQLIRRIIETSSNDNDLIVDPFSGSGMTQKVCNDVNRKCICIEKEKNLYELSLKFNEQKHNVFF